MIFQLHTRSDRRYRGNYPRRINSWSYSRSPSQDVVGRHLDMRRPVHFELNDGTRFIADMPDLNPDIRLGMEFNDAAPGPVIELSVERYDAMLTEIRAVRSQGAV